MPTTFFFFRKQRKTACAGMVQQVVASVKSVNMLFQRSSVAEKKNHKAEKFHLKIEQIYVPVEKAKN